MDVHIEFSEHFEREKLHKKLISVLQTLNLVAFAVIFGIAFINDGLSGAHALPLLFAATFLALSFELIAFSKRANREALLSSGFLLFVPWLAWLAFNALALSPFPGKAETAFCFNLIPAVIFFIAQQQSRNSGAQMRLLKWTVIFLFLGIVGGISYRVYLSEDFSGTLSMNILSGFLSDPAATGGVALLILFGAGVHTFHRGTELRKRLIALYVALAALGLVFLTQNTSVWIALFVGGIVTASLCFGKKIARYGLSFMLAVGIAIAPLFSEMPFSIPEKILAVRPADSTGTEEVPSRLSLQKIALDVFSENPVCGAGTGSFESEFQKTASSAWQVIPTTTNSLYTFVLAENGLVGFLFLFVPAGGIGIAAWRACNKLPRRKHGFHSRSENDEAFSVSNTRFRIAFLLGGVVAVGVLVALDFSPSFFPVILGVSAFGGILMHEVGGLRFNRLLTLSGTKRKAAFILSGLVPAGLFALCLPAAYSAEQCAVGKQALAPLFSDFYKSTLPSALQFDEATIREPLLAAVSAQKNNAEAWIALAQFYAYSVYLNPDKALAFERAMIYAATQACNVAPESAEAHLVKAVAEILLREDAAASESLRTAEALAPNNLPLLYQIARAYRLISEKDEAILRLVKRLAEIAPNSSRVRQIQSVVQLLELFNAAPKKEKAPDTSLFEL